MKNGEKYFSKLHMMIESFERSVTMFPSPEQIIHGIILAQINEFKNMSNTLDDFKLRHFTKNSTDMWKFIFSLTNMVHDFKKPLTHQILSNPNHSFVKTLVYIYSMDSFIFTEMNKTSRQKDTEKIKFYGPFATALSYIIHCGNKKYSKLSG